MAMVMKGCINETNEKSEEVIAAFIYGMQWQVIGRLLIK